MGVAHRSLPCGTKVSFLYNGRTITVPVVDRGPFGKGIDWDLTTAASDALGFTAQGRVTLGAVSLRRK
jgi:rare lipoprotein A (peptidoglycan hydrolase)